MESSAPAAGELRTGRQLIQYFVSQTDLHIENHVADFNTQANLANQYKMNGMREEALKMYRDLLSGYIMLLGEENEYTLISAINYASLLLELRRFQEAKSVLRKRLPVAQRVHGYRSNSEITLRMRATYAAALYEDDRATLDDLREAVNTLEQVARTARRVLGGAHPVTKDIEDDLRRSRAALRAREAAPK